ncbi:hypothetical protein AQUCO_00300180v1 [Aquilegia coerulea]|uniref:Dehydrogenase E1 component domain-containing protein n=1 Tax=Aquilegia coerulea TaxID=218851 RepID=A0A2G5EXK8_AQUCA|nr:hypothetical protein AQUCO_00300180v1 [Aquilegia coerulea]
MVLGRVFEEMCVHVGERGKLIGYVHLCNGQEVVSIGFIKLLNKEDCVVSTYRNHAHTLIKRVPAKALTIELFARAIRCCRGQGGSFCIYSKEHNMFGGFSFVGEGIHVATGVAFTSKYKREVLKQCLNMAQLWKLSIVFVVENNLWALGTSHLRATSYHAIYKKGSAFGMSGVLVDGMDIFKVREVAKEAIGRAKRGGGPSLIECETYRLKGHTLADSDEYRDDGEHSN